MKSTQTSLSKTALLVAIVLLGMVRPAMAAPVRLDIKIIHAHSQSNKVDSKLKDLVKTFPKLGYTAYELEDTAQLTLEMDSSGRIQLPTGQWLIVRPIGATADGKLRLDLSIKKLKFKTTVSVAPGATIAVGGPPHDEGVLILALTRPKDKE